MMRSVFILLALSLAAGADASHLSFKHYTTANGLPHSVVFRVMQDRNGFMWFGTDAGLARFDGNHIRTYATSAQDTRHAVLSIAEGPQRSLYISSYKDGLYQLGIDRPDSLFPIGAVRTPVPNRIVHLLWQDNKLWCLQADGRLGYLQNGTYRTVSHSLFVSALYKDPDSALYAATRNGLFVWRNGMLQPYLTTCGPVYDLAKDKSGRVWLGCKGKLLCCSQKDTLVYDCLPGEEVRHLLCDRSGRTWFNGNKQGLCYLENGKITSLSVRFNTNKIIANELYEDRDGNTWAATYGDGVYCFYNRFISTFPGPNGLSDQYIKCISEDRKGTLCVGTLTGAHLSKGNGFVQTNPGRYLSDMPVKFISSWATNYVIGTYEQVMITDSLFGHPASYDISGTALYVVNDHLLYIGSYGAVFTMERAQAPRKVQLQSESQVVNRIIRNRLGIYWIATDSGLVSTRDFRSFTYTFASHGLCSNKVNDVCLDRDDRLWIATSKGLNLMENGLVTTTYTSQDGLSHSDCITLQPGAQGNNIWIGTAKGVNWLNGKHIYQLGTARGLPADEITAMFYGTGRYLWVGTANGICKIDLEGFIPDPPRFKPAISEIRLEGGVAFAGEDSVSRFSVSQRSFTVCLTSFDYINPANVTFGYRVNNGPWQETQNAQIDFAGIVPGDYALQVKARNGLTQWSRTFNWRFTVPRPYWKTTAFRIALVATACLLLWLLVRARIGQVKKRESEKLDMYKNIQALKQHSLTSLLSPHFIFNALHSIQHFINKYDKRAANEYLADFAQLIRKTMDDASRIFISLRDELEHLELYLSLEKIRFGEKLSYEIVVDASVDLDETFLPGLMIQPYAENAIWHGLMNNKEGGRISIRIASDPQYLRIEIEDDGIGMDPRKTEVPLHPDGKPRGMQIARKRLELLGNMGEQPVRLEVTEGANGKGTKVCIHVPHAVTRLKESLLV